MYDALLSFGAISSFGASSATTYCADVLDLGANGSKFANDIPVVVEFVATAATTGFTPMLFSGSGSTPTDCVATGKTVTLAVGESTRLTVPGNLSRYLRAGGSATATTGAVKAYVTLGGDA